MFPDVGEPVFLLAACWFVGDSHFYPSGVYQWLEHLVPKLGAVRSVRNLHQITYCLFFLTVKKNFNLVPTWCLLLPLFAQ
jgi:hypothetical protein